MSKYFFSSASKQLQHQYVLLFLLMLGLLQSPWQVHMLWLPLSKVSALEEGSTEGASTGGT